MTRANRLKEYYVTGKYKGFYKIKKSKLRVAGKTYLAFSNGRKRIAASGLFTEDALEKIFDKIDSLQSVDSTRHSSGRDVMFSASSFSRHKANS